MTKPTIPKSIPRSKRRQAARIVAGMSPEDRAAWDEMVAEDGEMLMLCLQVQYERGGVFDLEGIKKHFRLSRILVGEEP